MAKKYLVETPVPDYCGIGAAGIHFAHGKAEVYEGWVLNWFKEHGYKVTPIDEEPKPIDKMTIEELKAYAEANGIDLGEAKKKEEILNAIKEQLK